MQEQKQPVLVRVFGTYPDDISRRVERFWLDGLEIELALDVEIDSDRCLRNPDGYREFYAGQLEQFPPDAQEIGRRFVELSIEHGGVDPHDL